MAGAVPTTAMLPVTAACQFVPMDSWPAPAVPVTRVRPEHELLVDGSPITSAANPLKLWGSRARPLLLTWPFYAARSYSLIRPPRTGRRLIRSLEKSAAR